ncbi:MAG: DUF523 domain-containing protein [Candidatus Marinarcus sp.]|uniref:DUF523 domain-containing protein n=1 Tax=Candidatus Marinarcus sp. TaxID=3100987 RepID=UPI003B006AE9
MKLLISSCLLGENVKYNGLNNKIDSDIFQSILASHTVFTFCPEIEGGLSTPRAPCEIQSFDPFLIKNSHGDDVTAEFLKGAKKALELCKNNSISIALLKANSPSCGNEKVYDGTFKGKLIEQSGVTAQFLLKNGIQVFNENQLKELNKALHQLR